MNTEVKVVRIDGTAHEPQRDPTPVEVAARAMWDAESAIDALCKLPLNLISSVTWEEDGRVTTAAEAVQRMKAGLFRLHLRLNTFRSVRPPMATLHEAPE